MLLRIEKMRVKYKSHTALDITEPIELDEGDRIGVIGSNGAGKSTLIRALVGLKDYEGRVESGLSNNSMAVQMQTNSYHETLSCRVIMERILDVGINEDEELAALIDYFDFGECLNKKYKELSGGQQQRFTIILVMMKKAKLTFYDEITSGLDFETRIELMDRLLEWYKDRDEAFVIVSHYYEELKNLTNKLLILDKGRVIAYGNVNELFNKYCGRSVIVIEDNEVNRRLTSDENIIHAPKGEIAIAPTGRTEEKRLSGVLIDNGISFRYSMCDIELLYVNARESVKND